MELPEVTLPDWLEEDENFQKVSGAFTAFVSVPTKTPPKRLEFDNKGRLIKNSNKGFVKKSFLGTYLDKD